MHKIKILSVKFYRTEFVTCRPPFLEFFFKTIACRKMEKNLLVFSNNFLTRLILPTTKSNSKQQTGELTHNLKSQESICTIRLSKLPYKPDEFEVRLSIQIVNNHISL